MTKPVAMFVLGVPVDGAKRSELRKLTGGLIPDPWSVPASLAAWPCGSVRAVRRQDTTRCAHGAHRKIEPVATVDLGNPESHLEGDS